MPRRNGDQLDLLSYRPPRPPKPKRRKRRKLAAVKIKFGPASGTFSVYDDSYDFPLLARRGSGEWVDVGWVEVMGVDVSSVTDRSTEYRVGEYRAVLANLDSPYMEAVMDLGDDADEYNVEVTSGTSIMESRYSKRVIRTAAEAKRMIKEWAAETLEAVVWEG